MKNNIDNKLFVLKKSSLCCLLVCAVWSMPQAVAGERESLEQLRATTVNLVNLLVQEGILSKTKADELIKQANQPPVAIAAPSLEGAAEDSAVANADDKTVRVQYVPEFVKKELREEIKKDVMAKLNYKAGERLGLPEWIDRVVWEGDLRLRYDISKYADTNPSFLDFNESNLYEEGVGGLENTTAQRNRLRLRARFGPTIKINNWLTGGIRMTTGNLTSPISVAQTQEAAVAKYTLGLDRVYLKADVRPWLKVVGGRFDNPWFGTDMMWDPDLAFDGVAASFTPKFNDAWSAFATLGAFPLDEIARSSQKLARNKWMYGSQLGIQWTSPNKSSIKLGVALFDFVNVEGRTNGEELTGPFDGTVPVFRTKGNSVFDINQGTALSPANEKFGLVSKFRNFELIGQIDLATFDPVHVTLTGDYTTNLGYDENDIRSRVGDATIGGAGSNSAFSDKQTDAYHLRLQVGMRETDKAHDWQAFVAYKRIEADAVLDSYTDSNFYLGGTNVKGWVIGGSYGLGKNVWLTPRFFSADELKPRGGLDPLRIDVLLLDLNAKF